MVLPIRPEDYGDPNWCPDCGEPRGVCRCDEEWIPLEDWSVIDEFHSAECTCETCLQDHPERDILYGSGDNFYWDDEVKP